MENQKIASPPQPEDVEGVVAFGSNASASYRYGLSLRNSKLIIWLENCKSKKQWETGELSMEAFVPAGGVIPRAGISDYFTCFRNALECSPESDESQRKLHAVNTGNLSLEFELKLTNLRDQEDELAKLRAERHRVPAKPIYLHVTSTNAAYHSEAITWSQSNSDCFKIDPNGAVEVTLAGVYMIHVVLRHRNSSNNEAFCLMKCNCSVGSCYDTSSSSSKFMSSPLMVMLELNANEKLSVLYKGNDHAIEGSNLTAFLLR